MDQAGKGWCAAGLISDSLRDDNHDSKMSVNANNGHVSLIDDELFTEYCTENPKSSKSLVDHLVPKLHRERMGK